MSQSTPLATDRIRRQPFAATTAGSPTKPGKREPLDLRLDPAPPRRKRKSFSKTRFAFFLAAAIVLIIGSLLFISTLHARQGYIRRASADGSAPSTVKPSAESVTGYGVAHDKPKYLNIPALGVHARVFQLGTLSNGSLAAPNNVFDTGWYDKSSLPGQPGAALIDGHVSSWTTRGVFYGLKQLRPGDRLTIVRGDDKVLTYQVVGSQAYPADRVDMKAALTPAVTGSPGLNLITCTGKVKPGTSEFDERVIVFTTQI